MGKETRRWFAVMAGGTLLALSATAAAGGKSSAASLSDAELDQITAGSVISGVLIFNPGKGPGAAIRNGTHTVCINCVQVDVPRTSGYHTVVTPNGLIVTNPIRQAPFGQ